MVSYLFSKLESFLKKEEGPLGLRNARGGRTSSGSIFKLQSVHSGMPHAVVQDVHCEILRRIILTVVQENGAP